MLIRNAQQGQVNIPALSPKAWYRFNLGITQVANAVSKWADQSGNGFDLIQNTALNKPVMQGDGSILFDGLTSFLRGSFTLTQPETVYILFKQVAWASLGVIFDGTSLVSMTLTQVGVSPSLSMGAGSSITGLSGLPVSSYGVVSALYNGVTSSSEVNNGALNSGDVGAGNAGGFTLGASGSAAPLLFSNIQVKEVIIFSDAHGLTYRNKVVNYLMSVGGL